MTTPSSRSDRTRHRRTASAVFVLVVLLGTVGMSGTTRAEIPHENYDIANPDLATVINLLNTSIRVSEEALKAFYNQSVGEANGYLSMVDSILVPAAQVLSKIEDVAGSYENLSTLLPPFLGLRAEMGLFSIMESDLLDARTRLVSLRDLANLTDIDLVTAIETIRTVNSLVTRMNSTIDDMLVSAAAITNMTVDGRTPFRPNDLAPLIERLRDLLNQILEEIEPIIHDDIPWGADRAFLILWVEDTNLYLGESVVGGGYLFYNGSFRVNHLVHILWDDAELIALNTDQGGAYRFSFILEIDASLLGQHVMVATATTPYTNLSSDEVVITVLLMPTSLSLDLDKTEMSINETVTATLTLKDVYGRAIPNATCELEFADLVDQATTDSSGSIAMSWTGLDLGFGNHLFSASYVGVLPYASSASEVHALSVSIPTHMSLELFSLKFVPGYYIVGVGKLYANETQTLPGQKIALYIDGQLMMNVSTDDNGQFAISIPSTGLMGGTHTLRASFSEHGIVWRYCDADVSFIITKLRRGQYPFFPFFPGWHIGPPEEIVYLFFGPYAYYFWLLMLVVLAIIVKTLQTRRARAKAPKDLTVATPLEDIAIAAAAESAISLAEHPEDWPSSAADSPRDPNGRIVWLYNMLLEFLRRKRKVTITDDMTHWEVARLLRSLGYPRDSVDRVTILFEKAFYSGAVLSDVDSVGMSVAMDGLRAGGAPNAR